MSDELLRRIVERERARLAADQEERALASYLEAWSGRPVLDSTGMRLGHVTHVRLDGTGAAWLEIATDWGLLDWLSGMGAGHQRFTFHSDDMEPQGEVLVLKRTVLESHPEAA